MAAVRPGGSQCRGDAGRGETCPRDVDLRGPRFVADRLPVARSTRTQRSRSGASPSGTGTSSPSTGSTSRSAAARSSRCSAPTAPARRRRWRSCEGYRSATAARSACWVTTRRTAPAAGSRGSGSCCSRGPATASSRCREMLQVAGVLLPGPARSGRGDRRWSGSRRRRTPAAGLSGGQRRRLDVALGIIGRPELLFLDEPTTGFDPEARRQFWSLIRDLREPARRSCSPRTTWTRPRRWPTGSA